MDKREKLIKLIEFLKSQSIKSHEVAKYVLFPTPVYEAIYTKTLLNGELACSIAIGFIKTVPDDCIEAMYIALTNLKLKDLEQFIKETP